MVWFDPLNFLFRSPGRRKPPVEELVVASGRTICDYQIPPKQTIHYKLNASTSFGKPQKDPSSLL